MTTQTEPKPVPVRVKRMICLMCKRSKADTGRLCRYHEVIAQERKR